MIQDDVEQINHQGLHPKLLSSLGSEGSVSVDKVGLPPRPTFLPCTEAEGCCEIHILHKFSQRGPCLALCNAMTSYTLEPTQRVKQKNNTKKSLPGLGKALLEQ